MPPAWPLVPREGLWGGCCSCQLLPTPSTPCRPNPYLLQPLRVVLQHLLQVLHPLGRPGHQVQRVSLEAVGAPEGPSVRSAGLWLRQQEGVAALTMLDTVRQAALSHLLPPPLGHCHGGHGEEEAPQQHGRPGEHPETR